ncbi:MAG TPA: translocation/assembly module TamB domain-containing protein, partial [Flavobacteriales bacterium]|nr:translocation/assembly module TamB domain-containing protein [Flavobacteriales bacterium]
GEWANARRAGIRIDSSTVRIHDLEMRNGSQRVVLNGTIASDKEQALAFVLDSLELSNFAPLIDGPPINGRLSADGRLFDLYGTPYAVSAARVDSMRVGRTPVGDVALAVSWLEGDGALDLNGRIERGAIKALDFTGRVGLRDGGALDMRAMFDRFDLGLANPYMPEGISQLGGHATGEVAVTGSIAHPDLKGTIDLSGATLRIDYLNTRYTGDARVRIGDELFAVDRAVMRDDEGHLARVGATVAHSALSNWSYDIWGTLDRVQVLNTTVAMNSLYYGRAYATGDFSVSGSRGSLEVNVQAATAPGTDIHLPVGGSVEVSPISFVHFGPIDTTGADTDVDLTGVSLTMEVTVTPDANFELIFDPTVGDIMSGRGAGMVELGITPRGDLSMNGQVTITEGDYLFTLRNVVNKRFAVQPGGRITWYGDPFDAQLDLQAIYRLKAPLYDVIPPGERNDSHRQRVPVEVVMTLREKM